MAFYQGLAVCLAIQATAMLTPGQNHMLLLSMASSTLGRRALAVLGIASAGVVFSTGVVVSIWLGGEAASARFFSVLNLLGASYLAYLGARFWAAAARSWRSGAALADGAPPASGRAPFLAGFMINIANPKSALFFASIFTATIPVARAEALDLGVAVVAFFVNSVIFHGAVAAFLGVRGVRRFLARWTAVVTLAAGTIFLGVGLLSGVSAVRTLAG